MNNNFISGTCVGEVCSVCGKPATNKLGEEIPHDDPNPDRHNLTAYVCKEHFLMIVGSKDLSCNTIDCNFNTNKVCDDKKMYKECIYITK